MAKVVPSITGADTPEEYTRLLSLLKFAPRLHIDLSDGIFAPNPTINPVQIYWPEGIEADVHLMHSEPARETETLISLKPHLVTIHVEAKDGPELTKLQMLESLRAVGIKTGVALLAETPVDAIKPYVDVLDHVLIFSGKLGYYGGSLAADQLIKVQAVKELVPHVEVGWDGGANDSNIEQIVKAGVDAVTVGGYLQKAQNAQSAYATLEAIVNR